ncbi:MAG: hypothetical protein HFG77_10680 [Hungatella sp.]|nr:hypothetical protein [Hungatella sp.]
MIVSRNPVPSLHDFQILMCRVDQFLNDDAKKRPQYYAARGGSPLEDDVMIALVHLSAGTLFENTIVKVSGQKFPDIIAANFYGVEVKSTKSDQWTTTGSSILETTRVPGVERIYITFGKLGGNPIEFLSRPYEECLSGIAVTHMPRYLIDMRLGNGQTIFDKMGISYDALRQLDNPIAPVSSYYRSQLKPGERLWWTGDPAEESVPPTIRLWKTIPALEQDYLVTYGCVNFPELFGGDYDGYALWLTSLGVVNTHIRDQFSSGGQEPMRLSDGTIAMFPGVYRRVKRNLGTFLYLMSLQEPVITGVPLSLESPLGQRLMMWSDAVSRISPVDYHVSMDALTTLFFRKS